MSKPVLLGEAPSKSGDRYHMFPLSGAVAQALCKMADIKPLAGESRYGQWTWALYEHFECENLIERWPGAQGRGSAFPLAVARPLAVDFVKEHDGRVVVLLGSRLKSLFTVVVENYVWHEKLVAYDGHGGVHQAGCQVVAIPHPSGLNRVLNDQAERDRSGAVLREAIDRARKLEARVA
jgi:uracil-DNA glycosylase